MRYFLWRFVGVGDDGLVPMNVGLVKNIPAAEILSVASGRLGRDCAGTIRCRD